MNGEQLRALSAEEFTRQVTKKLTKKQLAFLDEWAESFEKLTPNVQICLAHYVVHDFLGLEEVMGDAPDGDVPQESDGGGMYG